MSKLFSTLLLLIILTAFFFILLYISFNFIAPDNPLNQVFRLKIAKIVPLRKIFKLYQVGDARSDYLTIDNFKKLEITVYSFPGESLNPLTKEKIVDQISQIIEQPKQITIVEKNYREETNAEVDDKMIHSLLKAYPVNLKGQANLQIFILDRYSPQPSFAGLVKNAYSIFLFNQPINNISNFETSTYKIETSTILHEFAHLLGAGHVEKDGCILSEKVENITYGRPTMFTTTYCVEDIEKIESAL